MPERVQLKRAKGWRMPENTVKVDRSTWWGNPFTLVSGPAAKIRWLPYGQEGNGGSAKTKKRRKLWTLLKFSASFAPVRRW